MDYLGTKLVVRDFQLSQGGGPSAGEVLQATDSSGNMGWRGSNAVAIPLALTPGTNCAAVTKTGTVYNAQYLGFTQDVDGYCYGSVLLPNDFVVTNASITVSYACWTATSGVARLNVEAVAASETDSMDPGSFTVTGTAVDSTVPGSNKVRKDVTWSISTLPFGALDQLLVRISHLGAHANDTIADTVLLLDAWLNYTIT